DSLRNGGVLQQRRIQFGEPGSDQHVPTHVSVSAVRRNEKRVGIEVLVRPPKDQLSIEDRIPGGSNRVPAIAIIRRIKSQLRRERETGLQCFDSTQHPSARQLFTPPAHISQERLPLAERQLI